MVHNSLIEPTWAIGGGLLAAGIGLGFIPFLRKIPRSTAILFIVAGAAYLGGAVGMEILSDPFDSDTMTYNLLTVIEEGLEMTGVILLIYALMEYMKGSSSEVEAKLEIG